MILEIMIWKSYFLENYDMIEDVQYRNKLYKTIIDSMKASRAH